jgi:hypothetical protein
MTDSEQMRLQEAHENTKPWYRWGPYLTRCAGTSASIWHQLDVPE